LLMQLLSAVGKIRTAGAERRAFAQWSGLFAKQVRASVQASRVDNLLGVFGGVYPLFTMMAIFAMVGGSLSADRMNTGDFLAFNAAFSVFLGATLQLGSIGVSALEALPAWERAKPILAAVPESHAMKSDPGRLRGAIEFQRVSFRYTEDGPMILKEVNFTVKPGECIAIVGPSGSGKSTLLRLLLGFEVPTTGAVYFDGHDLERVDLYALRRQLGVVLQDGAIMSGDIYSNIAGANRVELDDAWEAARKAALDEEIRAMPMGMHTVMPEGGGTLSGGQRQRLMIARALVRNPRILLLDEATSALDNQSQARVTSSVAQLKATRIIIAHRLTTIRHVDRILVVKDGVLVEQGSFDALMAIEDGVFAALARRQMLGDA
jgi:ABC-type bacteriocin/lantibiotic exporter with double-glycine peptidase domain